MFSTFLPLYGRTSIECQSALLSKFGALLKATISPVPNMTAQTAIVPKRSSQTARDRGSLEPVVAIRQVSRVEGKARTAAR
jgi:hypothetical protein